MILSMTDAVRSESDADLDSRLARYITLGYSPERALGQLLLAGFPVAALKRRFPDLPDAAFLLGLPPAVTPPKWRSAMGPTAGRPQVSGAVTKPLGPATEDGGVIAYHYVPLIQCSFPHADPGDAASFTRRNGWLELTVGTTRPSAGLPYGVPARLLTIYCTSEAIRSRAPEIYLGSSLHDFLRRLDVPITRGDRGSLRVYANQLLRLIHATLTIDEHIRDDSGRTGMHIRQALFAEEARLWWDEDRAAGEGSSMLISQVLFQSILERSAPLSAPAIKALRKSPMDLDVYAWLVHRLYQLNKPSAVTWEQLSQQFGHSYRALRAFRRFFGDSLARVRSVYPDANVKVSETGLLLLPSRPHVAPRARLTR
jgi:Plasmid encoded RepA protein